MVFAPNLCAVCPTLGLALLCVCSTITAEGKGRWPTVGFFAANSPIKKRNAVPVEAYSVVRRHIVWLSALRAGRPLAPGRFLVLIYLKG
jgi:hypothetical protein